MKRSSPTFFAVLPGLALLGLAAGPLPAADGPPDDPRAAEKKAIVHGEVSDPMTGSVASAHVTVWFQVKDDPSVVLDENDREMPSVPRLTAALAGVEPSARCAILEALSQRCTLVRAGEGFTSAEGNYSISVPAPLEPGRITTRIVVVASTVVASKDGGGVSSGKSEAITLRTGRVGEDGQGGYGLNLELAPMPSLSIVVRDALAPVPSALVLIRQTEPHIRRPPPRAWKIDREGLEDGISYWPCTAYELATGEDGIATTHLSFQYWTEVELIVRIPGRAIAQDMVVRQRREPDLFVPIEVEPDAPITGEVLGPGGAPVASASLVAFEGYSAIASTTTGGDGGFELRGLSAKTTYHVVVVPQEAGLAAKRCELDGGTPGQRIVLESAGVLEIRLQPPDASDRGDRGATEPVSVTVERDAGGTAASAQVRPSAVRTLLRLPSLAPGGHKVLINSNGRYAPERIEAVAIVASATKTLEVRLRRPRTVTGTIVDGNGRSLEANIRIDVPGFFGVSSHCTNGHFSVDGLPWFELTASVSSAGYKPRSVPISGDVTDLGKVVLERDEE